MVELQKEPSYPVQLGLGPGTYRVSLDAATGNFQARVALEEGSTVRLDGAQFTPVNGEPVAARGPDATPPSKQEDTSPRRQTHLFDGPLSFGGYAGLGFRYAKLAQQDALMAGVEGALLLNHRLAIGFAAYGGSPDGGDLVFGYGGPIVRHHFLFEDSPFNFSLAAHAAGGGIDDSALGDDSDDAVFVFEPHVSGHLNLARWMRLGVDVGYRFIAGADPARFSSRDFGGFMAGFHTQLGWF